MSEGNGKHVYTNPLALVLEHLIDNAPPENQGAAEVQILLRVGPVAWNGPTRRGEFPGTFVTTSLAEKTDEQTGRKAHRLLDVHFLGDDLLRVETSRDHEPSRIVAVTGAGLPGLRR